MTNGTNMARISIESTNVLVNLTSGEKFFAVHGSLRIPLTHVTSVHVEDEDGWQHMWRKLVGTGVPQVKMAGTFMFPGGLAFLDYTDGRNCVVIETTQESYRYVVVQPERDQDPDAIAAEINRRAGRT